LCESITDFTREQLLRQQAGKQELNETSLLQTKSSRAHRKLGRAQSNSAFFILALASGDSRMKKVGGPLRGQGKIRGGNINIYLAW